MYLRDTLQSISVTSIVDNTRKYPLRGYILGVLTLGTESGEVKEL